MIMRLFKKADKVLNRILLPKFIIDKWGRDYYLEIYEDHMKLIPAKKGE